MVLSLTAEYSTPYFISSIGLTFPGQPTRGERVFKQSVIVYNACTPHAGCVYRCNFMTVGPRRLPSASDAGLVHVLYQNYGLYGVDDMP